jgi:hypothetical protein
MLLFLLVSGSVALQQETADSPEITAREIQQHISYLASDALEGRFTGSQGCQLAGEYIKNEFQKYGLEPLFGDSYFQHFPFIAEVRLTDETRLTVETPAGGQTLQLDRDYRPLAFSDDAEFSGEVVFAGYGISAKDLQYDDYAGIEVEGKVVLVLRSHPEWSQPRSKFDRYDQDRLKATVARDHGAKAILIANGPYPEKKEDRFKPFRYDRSGAVKGIAVVQISRKLAEALVARAGKDLKALQHEIDSLKAPRSFELGGVKIRGKVGIQPIQKISRNVAGVLPGSDPLLKDEYVVIGAHYDHLGYGQTGSLYRGEEPRIHNGADDNASGTAAMLEMAEKFASLRGSLKRSYIFVAFSGEELGSIGSSYFVKNSPVPTEKMVAMINLDMVGRLREDSTLIVYGTGTSSRWKDLLNELNRTYRFKLSFHDEGFGPSDHSSFYAKKIPVLFFFTGTHSDYHRPTDDPEKINAEGEEAVTRLAFDVAAAIDTFSTRPDYIAIARRESGGRRDFRVYVGTIPDFSEDVDGYKISGVSEGSPAAKAGLQAGDVIIKFGGKPVSNIYDFTYALQDFAPGDSVEIVWKRGAKVLRKVIELEAR